MSAISAPAITITSVSDPHRPMSEIGDMDVGGEVTPLDLAPNNLDGRGKDEHGPGCVRTGGAERVTTWC